MARKGFTLIETVIVILILSIIAAIASKVMQAAFNAYFTNQYITNANIQARLALERLSRDVRAISSAGSISTATASQLSFTDVNGNTITYQLTGSQLMRSGQVLADGVSNLSFTYLDRNAASTTTPANICYVTTTLGFNSGGVNYTVRSTATAMNYC